MGARLSHAWAQIAVLLAVCAVVYFPFLAARPFDYTEGHRVVPAWTMLESGEWWRMRMFGATYLRKPPGMPWAIAASSAVLGQNEFAARLPSALSATAMALVAWAFTRRWMGRGGWALGAGLAQTLMPQMWSPGRTAEIEMLNNFGAQLLAFGVVDIYWRGWFGRTGGGQETMAAGSDAVPRRLRAVGVLACVAGLVVSAAAKGPAALPVLAGVVGGAVVLARSARPIFNARVWFALIVGAAVIVPLWVKFVEVNHDPLAVREDVAGQFLWSSGRIAGVLTLAPIAFASALPASLALLMVFGRAPRLEAAESSAARDAYVAARLCAFGWIGSVLVLMLAGVSNPRYAMPCAALLPPVAGYVVRGLALAKAGAPGGLGSARVRAAGVLTVGRPVVLGVALTIGAVVAGGLVLVRRGDADAGIEAARVFARALPPGAMVWADEVVEARPDVLVYAERFAPGSVNSVWAKRPLLRGDLPAPGLFVLLRTDEDSGERGRYAEMAAGGRMERVASARVRAHEFTLFRVLN